LGIGVVAAGVIGGPDAFRLFSTQMGMTPRTPDEGPNAETIAAQRQREVTRLNGYGWIDKNANVVHIPIDQAMVLLAETGLPVGVTPTASAAPATTPPAAAEAVDLTQVSFKDNVLPIFEQHCAECHGDEKSEEGLKLIRYRTVIGGSQNGPVVEPGDPDNSYLVEMVVSGKMPKEGDPLTAAEIEIIKAWITAGALDN
jgi:mono/diheme cytochrome c family protein